MSEDRRAERRELVDHIGRLMMQVQCSGDPEVREALSEAREALRRHDAESLRKFNREISGAGR